MATRIVISLTQTEVDYLHKDIQGQGGFQSLLRGLQTKLHGNSLELDLDDVERVARYVKDYGGGSFQGRLEGVLNEIRGLANALRAVIE